MYDVGCAEELSICAFYDESRRDRGAEICDKLALSRIPTWHSREQARSNLFWYLKPLVQHVPSFRPTRIPLEIPEGYVATNPSVTNYQGQPVAIVRTVNYTITPEGHYAVRGDDGSYSRDHPIRTVNHLVTLSRELEIESSCELALPDDWPEPKFDLVRGFEDSRLFEYHGFLWTLSTVRETTPEGWCEQVLSKITPDGYEKWVRIQLPRRLHEKNWMPWIDFNDMNFVYRLGTVLNNEGGEICSHDTGLSTDHISGGSQVIGAEGYWIALVHEARTIPGRTNQILPAPFCEFS